MLTRAYRYPCRAISGVVVRGSSCTEAASKVTRVGAAVVRGGSDALQLAPRCCRYRGVEHAMSTIGCYTLT